MQSALVRRDAVMLHDPMRTHSRATMVGVVLGALGMLGFVIFGFFSPKPTPPDDGGVVIAKESGAVYLLSSNPRRLTPVFNLASARLLQMAQQQNAQQGGEAAAEGGGAAPQEAKVVPEEQLKDIPRGNKMGIPDAPELLPTKEQQIAPNWAVCDGIEMDQSLEDRPALDNAVRKTTVLGGVTDLGPELESDKALLVEADNGTSHLIFRLPDDPNRPNSDTVRAEVNLDDDELIKAFELNEKPRPISTGMLDAIPPVPKLEAPKIAGAGEKSQFDLPGVQVGDVFSVSRAGQEEKNYWLASRSGIQAISPAVADLVKHDRQGEAEITRVSPDKTSGIPVVQAGSPDFADVDEYPAVVPKLLSPHQYPVSCLGWKVAGEGDHRDAQTTMHVGTTLPGPKNGPDGQLDTVKVGSANPDGLKIDQFYMQPGLGAVVHAATGSKSLGSGPISVISDRGMRYGVPDEATAQGLGLTDRQPAPESIVGLLPVGAQLNTGDAQRVFDDVPIDPDAGSFPTQQPQAANPGGG